MKWTPDRAQTEGLRLILSNPAAGLFADPGLGKTTTMLAAFAAMRAHKPKWRMLVIAPKSVALHTWPGEVRKFENFAHLKLVVLHGPGSAREDAARSDADVYVINPEGMPWLAARGGVGRSPSWPEVLCVDESTKYKHTGTERFKTLRPLLDHFERRYILTGKPMPNGLLDLFGQIFVLDGGQRLGRFVSHYRNKWFYPTGYGGYKWAALPGAEAEILAKIEDITLRLDKYDYLDLAKPLIRDVVINLPHAVFDRYAQLERDFVVKLRDGEVTAVNAAALTAKLRQFASGAVYTTTEGDALGTATGAWSHVHDAKIDALDALLAEREGSPTFVVYQWNHSADRIVASRPKGDVVVWGRLTPSAQKRALDAWNAGDLPVLAAHPASAAHGLNLQAGSECIVWFDPTYDLEHYEQTIARLHRRGQTRRVVVHRIVARDTIDEVVLGAIAAKDRTQSAFLAALKAKFGAQAGSPSERRAAKR